MKIKLLMTALALLATFQVSTSQPNGLLATRHGAGPQKALCRCNPRCPSGYFCEQDGTGGCFCSPI